MITKLEQVNHSLSKIKTLSVFIQFWLFIPFWNQERKKITFRINLRQSGQVRLSLEGFLAVLFVLITKLVQVNRRLSKITTLSVFIRFWCFIPFWNQETKQITFRMNLRQSGQVRLSPEGCLAVLFVLRNAKPFWIHKVMIQRVKDYQSLKYQINIFSQLIFIF